MCSNQQTLIWNEFISCDSHHLETVILKPLNHERFANEHVQVKIPSCDDTISNLNNIRAECRTKNDLNFKVIPTLPRDLVDDNFQILMTDSVLNKFSF